MHHDKLKDFTSETARKAGRKSKRRSLDAMIQEQALKLLTAKAKKGERRTKSELMIEVAYTHFLKGNSRPLQYLIDRGFGKAKDNVSMTLNDISLRPDKITIEVVKPK